MILSSTKNDKQQDNISLLYVFQRNALQVHHISVIREDQDRNWQRTAISILDSRST